ncbi:MAG: hypothetical protein IH789_06625 [Acidobacteria bacterium]|nr:hypothetical protein [Acidobacteriota bacterium]
MRAIEIQLLLVILGLVISTSLLLNPPELWSVALSFLTLSGTLIAFSTWVRNRTLRSRSILSNGAAAWLAAALWLKYLGEAPHRITGDGDGIDFHEEAFFKRILGKLLEFQQGERKDELEERLKDEAQEAKDALEEKLRREADRLLERFRRRK